MRTGFLKHYVTTAFLSVMFFYAGFVCINAYTDFSIQQKKLNLLRGQERFVKLKLNELKEKKQVLAILDTFVDKAGEQMLLEDQWDVFAVDLKDEPFTFEKLEAILAQTVNTGHYLFVPENMTIRLGSVNREDESNIPAAVGITDKTQAQVLENRLAGTSDAVISLKGRFFVRKTESDE